MAKNSRIADILPSRGDIGLERIIGAIEMWIDRQEKSKIIDLHNAFPDEDKKRIERIVEGSFQGAKFYNEGKRRKLKTSEALAKPTSILADLQRAAEKGLSFRSKDVEALVWRPASLAVASRVIVNALPEQLGLLVLPVLEGVNGRPSLQG